MLSGRPKPAQPLIAALDPPDLAPAALPRSGFVQGREAEIGVTELSAAGAPVSALPIHSFPRAIGRDRDDAPQQPPPFIPLPTHPAPAASRTAPSGIRGNSGNTYTELTAARPAVAMARWPACPHGRARSPRSRHTARRAPPAGATGAVYRQARPGPKGAGGRGRAAGGVSRRPGRRGRRPSRGDELAPSHRPAEGAALRGHPIGAPGAGRGVEHPGRRGRARRGRAGTRARAWGASGAGGGGAGERGRA